MSDDTIIPIVPPPSSVNACDVMKGPCACGAWHVMPAEDKPVKTLLKAAKDLRAAQRNYMAIRSSRPEGDAVRQYAGILVAEAAEELDRAIEATERRQASADRFVRQLHAQPKRRDPQEPSITEQHAMGVPSTGGEIPP